MTVRALQLMTNVTGTAASEGHGNDLTEPDGGARSRAQRDRQNRTVRAEPEIANVSPGE